jgi:hypothetical protein
MAESREENEVDTNERNAFNQVTTAKSAFTLTFTKQDTMPMKIYVKDAYNNNNNPWRYSSDEPWPAEQRLTKSQT